MDHTLSWWRLLLLTLIVGGLIAAWIYLNRHRLHPKQWLSGSSSLIEILEKKWMGPKNTILLIRIEEQYFLLSQTPAGSSWQKLDPLKPESLQKISLASHPSLNPSPPPRL